MAPPGNGALLTDRSRYAPSSRGPDNDDATNLSGSFPAGFSCASPLFILERAADVDLMDGGPPSAAYALLPLAGYMEDGGVSSRMNTARRR